MKVLIRLEEEQEIGIVINVKIIILRGENLVVVVIATKRSEKNRKTQWETNSIKQPEEIVLSHGSALAAKY